jgi:hypothetical protein
VSGLTRRPWNGRFGERWTYRYVNDVPLRAEADPLHVNWCELTVTDERDGRTLYHNAFVTNHVLSDDTVAPIVAAGRTRWKVENEGNNTLTHRPTPAQRAGDMGKLRAITLNTTSAMGSNIWPPFS